MLGALKRLLGMNQEPLQPVQKIGNLDQLLNVKNGGASRLQMLSGDQQLNEIEKPQGNLFEGLQMNGRPMGVGNNPAPMPRYYIPGTEFNRFEDGSTEMIQPPLDQGIYGRPVRPRTPPRTKYRVESI